MYLIRRCVLSVFLSVSVFHCPSACQSLNLPSRTLLQFFQVMSLVRKELLNAVYSDVITSSVERRKDVSGGGGGGGGGRKRGKEKEEKREFLERIPYFTLVQRMREGQVSSGEKWRWGGREVRMEMGRYKIKDGKEGGVVWKQGLS